MFVHACGRSLQSVWVRKGALRWWRDWRPQRWVDVGVALEQSTKSDGRKDSIFFVYYTQYDEKKVGLAVMPRLGKILPSSTMSKTFSCVLFILQYLHVFINEVTALVPVLRDSHYAFAVYTSQRIKQRWPLVLAAQTERDMNEWVTRKYRECFRSLENVLFLGPEQVSTCEVPIAFVVTIFFAFCLQNAMYFIAHSKTLYLRVQ